MSAGDVQALLLTLKLALVSSLLLLVVAIPLAWALHKWRHPIADVVQAVVALPLVLPPTVLGFYLLIAFAPSGVIGQTWFSVTGTQLAFSFEALVMGSMVYSLPFAVQPLISGFRQFNRRYLVVANMLAMPKRAVFTRVFMPINMPHFLTAFVLAFAHTIGEFGVVLMIGGNIPGETKVVSISLFEHVEAIEYDHAHQLALVLVGMSFALLVLIFRLNRRQQNSQPFAGGGAVFK